MAHKSKLISSSAACLGWAPSDDAALEDRVITNRYFAKLSSRPLHNSDDMISVFGLI